ncbi:hypothetical protein [Ascidiaceihabitans sp.]|uniref:hypothetical protein n=1 Tax=Ascidiaceihabitans sp. TaxID=1872644 RepID=UPI003297204A
MTNTSAEFKVTSASDIEVDRATLDASISKFAGCSGDYYTRTFHKIHNTKGWIPNTFNPWAAVLGPFWSASRAIWGLC